MEQFVFDSFPYAPSAALYEVIFESSFIILYPLFYLRKNANFTLCDETSR